MGKWKAELYSLAYDGIQLSEMKQTHTNIYRKWVCVIIGKAIIAVKIRERERKKQNAGPVYTIFYPANLQTTMAKIAVYKFPRDNMSQNTAGEYQVALGVVKRGPSLIN